MNDETDKYNLSITESTNDAHINTKYQSFIESTKDEQTDKSVNKR